MSENKGDVEALYMVVKWLKKSLLDCFRRTLGDEISRG